MIMQNIYFVNTQIYYIHQGTLVLNLAKIDSSVQIFTDFEFSQNFFKII